MTDKKILVLCRRDDREEYDRRITMLRELSKVAEPGVVYAGADYEDLVFSFDGDKLTVVDTVSGTDIADYDAIFLIGWFKSKTLDDVARAVAFYADHHNIPFTNTEAYFGRSFTKLSQCVIAALNGVQVTPFLFCLDQAKLMEAVKQQDLITFPYIAKAVSASRGKDNYLVEDHATLEKAMGEEYDIPRYFIVQQFVPNDGDYRILVMGGRVRMVIHRLAQAGSHVNNTSQGGTATVVDAETLPKDVIEDSIRLAGIMRREVTGVDMIKHRDTGEYYFLELNNMPQLATGSFVPQKIQVLHEHLVELASRKSD